MLRVALKGLWGHKFRLIATSIAVVIGVASLAGTLVFTSTMNRNFDDLFATAFENTDAFVRGEEPKVGSLQGEEAQRAPLDESLLPIVSAVPGVKEATGYVEQYAQPVGKDGEPLTTGGAPTFGTNWSTESGNPFTIVDGGPPRSDNEVVIDRGTAEKGDLRVGDPITVLVSGPPVQAKVSGIAAFGTADNPGGVFYVFFTEDAAQRVLNREGKYDNITVIADEGISQEEIRDRVAAALPTNLEVLTGKEITEELQSMIKDQLGVISIFFLVFAGIMLFVGTFIIYNTFSILVTQRTKEHALLRAIGASRRQITRAVLIEAFAVGVVAGGIGFVAGVGVAYGLKAMLSAFGADLPADGLVVPPDAIVWSFAVAVIVSMLSAWLPARRAARIPPVAAMRDLAVDRTTKSFKRLIFGVLLLAVGVAAILVGLFTDVEKGYIPVGIGALVTFLGVSALGPTFASPVSRVLGFFPARTRGVAGRLATDNARRNPRRTAATASALMIGVGLVGLMLILTSSLKASVSDVLDRTYKGDFVLTSPATFQVGLPVELASDLAKLPEVGAVAGLSGLAAEVDGSTNALTVTDMSNLQKVLDPEVSSGSLAAFGADGISVYKDTANEKHWSVGQQISIQFNETADKTFTVKAIHDNDMLGPYVIDKAAFASDAIVLTDYWLMLARADGVSAESARSAVNAVADRFPQAKVQDQTEFKEDIANQVNQILGFFLALLALSILIAVIGIANALVLSVYERTRELGLLRAVGMTRRQLRTCVRWEAIIVALFGTILGLLVAVFFGVSLVSALETEGVTELRVPAGSLALVTFLGAVVGVLAAIWPAWRASRLKVLEAITFE